MPFGITDPPPYDDLEKIKRTLLSVFRWFESSTKTANVTTTYTVPADVSWVRADATSGAFTVTLPVASENWRREIGVIKIDSSANAVTVSRSGSDKINGANTQSLGSQYSTLTAKSDGNINWDLR